MTSTPNPQVALLRWSRTSATDGRTAARTMAHLLLGRAEHWRLDAPPGTAPRLLPVARSGVHHVSLSHTHVAAAAAIGARVIGVDLESVHRRVNWIRIAQTYFSPTEQTWLEQQRQDIRKAAFLALWTCKEAWLKAHRLDLSHLERTIIEPSTHRWRIPGAGVSAETRLLPEGLVVSVVWHEAGRPLWLQGRLNADDDSLTSAANYELRWHGTSADS